MHKVVVVVGVVVGEVEHRHMVVVVVVEVVHMVEVVVEHMVVEVQLMEDKLGQ